MEGTPSLWFVGGNRNSARNRLYFVGSNRLRAFCNGAFLSYEEALDYQAENQVWDRVYSIYEVEITHNDLEEI